MSLVSEIQGALGTIGTDIKTIQENADLPGVRYVNHGATASTARPTVPSGWIVLWVGSAVPDNKATGDLHIKPSA